MSAMDQAQALKTYRPGQRVIITQQIPQRNQVLHARVEGEVVSFDRRKTGSWYAHAKDHKLWLDRLMLRKDDGEVVQCILDSHTRIEVVPDQGKASTTGVGTQDVTNDPIDDPDNDGS